MEKTPAILSKRQHGSLGAPGEVKALQLPFLLNFGQHANLD